MATNDEWMPLYVGRYIGDTGHLTYDQHGPYLLLLMHYWRKGPLPDNDVQLSAISRVPLDIWVSRIGPILREFFTLGADGKLHQKRADQEWEKRAVMHEKRVAAGQAGSRKRWGVQDDNFVRASARVTPIRSGDEPDIASAIAHATDLPWQTDSMVQVHKHIPEAKLQGASAPPAGEPVDLFGETPPAPPPKPSEHPVRHEGMELLTWIAGQSDPAKLAKLMNATISSAGGDRDLVLQALRDTHAKPAKYANIGTLKSLIAERMPKTPRASPRVVVDNTATPDDPWGIQAWSRSLPGVKPTESDAERRDGNWKFNGAIIDYWATEILQASGFPTTWRGDLSVIIDWSQTGAFADDVAAIIRERVATAKNPITSLRYFDLAIRGRRSA